MACYTISKYKVVLCIVEMVLVELMEYIQLPDGFRAMFEALLPAAPTAHSLLAQLDTNAVVSVRLHPEKGAKMFTNMPAVHWCREGRYLPFRPYFAHDPHFWAGAYYVQEASSMFVGYAFQQLQAVLRQTFTRPLVVLDLCAAPGGKSTHILSLLSDADMLISNEIVVSRLQVLVENLNRWGIHRFVISQSSAADFANLAGCIDCVVADVPCSGEGMFRKDMEARQRWSPKLVVQCATLQRQIVEDVMPALREGGFLLYSTCTFNTIENEENVAYFIDHHGMQSVPLALPEDSGIQLVEQRTPKGHRLYAYRFFPGLVKGEGFFLSVLQKQSRQAFAYKKARQRFWQPLAKHQQDTYLDWLQAPQAWQSCVSVQNKTDIHLMPAMWPTEWLDFLQQQIKPIQVGMPLGQVLKGKFNPHPLSAYARVWCPAVPAYELSGAEALDYLRRQPVSVLTGLAPDWYLISYEGQQLGWIKALGGRYNNYYPNDWQLRT